MPETPTIEVSSESAQPAISARDLQRKALRDLVTLAIESATTEADIEKRMHDTLADADKQYQRTLQEIEHQIKTIREQIAQKHRDRLKQIDDSYKSETQKLASSAEAMRRRIDHDHANVEEDAKEKFQQASWLAESVFDGTVAQLAVEAKQAKETVELQIEQCNDLFAQATKAMVDYGQMPPPASEPAPGAEPTGAGSFDDKKAVALRALDELAGLSLPKFFTGVLPFLIAVVATGAAAGGAYTLAPQKWGIALGAGIVVFGITVALGVMLKRKSQQQLAEAMARADQAIGQVRLTAQAQYRATTKELEQRRIEAEQVRKGEVDKVRAELSPLIQQSARRKETALVSAQAEQGKMAARLQQQRESALNEAETLHRKQSIEFEHRVEREHKIARDKRDMRKADAQFTHKNDRAGLEQRLSEGLKGTQTPVLSDGHAVATEWTESAWADWKPPKTFSAAIRFGSMGVDLQAAAAAAAGDAQLTIQLPEQFPVPATLQFPSQGSMLIQTDRTGREEGIRLLQTVMARLLTCQPAGRARFTIFDPVGLGQNFAGFMRLADYDENLVGQRIWTEAEHINQRLANLSEHMETVIQKYLRNEFATIDDYNAQAGELAEPYRFLVIADFPQAFQVESIRRLASIVGSGARCGVYVLILRDKRIVIPSGAHLEDIEAHCINLIHNGEKFLWKDPVFEQFPLQLDPPPGEEFLTRLLDRVGQGAKEANRVEVSFDTISPKPEEFWSMSCADELRVPIGRMGATRLQMLRLGKGVAQHALVAGKTGSGKSTLLNAMVTNLAMWYSPDEVEFYLIDFKKGVEFKAYAVNHLPHARAIAVESDREFGISVLHRLDAELTRRGDLFRKAGVQDLPSYRKLADALTLPRTLLIIDEFQEFFSEDDKLAQDASVLLDRLVRQGRAFGIHVMLGSQTIGGTSGLARSTIGQMAVRIALQCSEADSQMILGDNNFAARLLSRPGEAIYNDAGGLVEGNSPFQIAWLPDEKREIFLANVKHKAVAEGKDRPEAIVFEGNQPAEITKNWKLMRLLNAGATPALVRPEDSVGATLVSSSTASTNPVGAALVPPFTAPTDQNSVDASPVSAPAESGDTSVAPTRPGVRIWPNPKSPIAWLGEPVAIKDATAISFRRQSGANTIIVGQQDEAAVALVSAILVGLAAQLAPDQARFVLLDGTPVDSSLSGMLAGVKAALPHPVQEIEYRGVSDVIAEIHAELLRRRDGDEAHPPGLFLIIHGLQRYRALRRSEESFSFSMEEGEKKPQTDKQLAEILREGPTFGIHVITWVDTPASIERTFDRSMLREFDHRILFQMSASDSSLLVDSPIANKLGQNRALYYSEEQGVIEKFRPYGLPTKGWLERVKAGLGQS